MAKYAQKYLKLNQNKNENYTKYIKDYIDLSEK